LDSYKDNLPEVMNFNIGKELLILFKIDKTDAFNLLKTGKQLSDFISKFKFSSITVFPLEYLFRGIKYDLTKYLIEGMFFGFYVFDEFKTDEKNDFTANVNLFAGNKNMMKKAKNILEEIPIIFKYVNLYRDLVNLPPAELTPAKFSDKIKDLKNKDLELEILDKDLIIKNNYNLIYAVGKGSKNPPYFIKLRYIGDKNSNQHIALVGKGVTFDSGGTNLKPTGHIETMKMDMTGAALMFSLTMLIAELKLPVNIYTYLPLVENILGQDSYKPGDIIKSASGKTVEILNTDAEGRLILADALFEASRHNPKLIIDAATLTGACIVALGSY
jgi:leucyl aminopeptidase